jgi:hypothetical protein
MQRWIRTVASLAFVLLPAILRAQSTDLSELLLQFFSPSNPLVLKETGHQAHFASQTAAQQTLAQLNRGLASQLSTFPLGSSSGGFTYSFDPTLGVFTRRSESFGPTFAERAITAGKGKVNVGLSYLKANFDSFEGQKLKDGDISLFLTHTDPGGDGPTTPFYEGDIIQARLFLDIKSETVAFVANYGLTDRLDVGLAVPYVRLDFSARIRAAVEPLATSGESFTFHVFPDGTTQHDYVQAGSAEGIGDVVFRTKYVFVKRDAGGLAAGLDLRLPTGDERNLLGSGATQAKVYIIGSATAGRVSPHANLGYTFSKGGAITSGNIPDELNYTVGADAALGHRVTLNADLIGRTLQNSERLTGQQREFHFVRSNGALGTAVRTEFTSQSGDLNVILGSAGLKFNPFGNLLVSGNVLFSTARRGLQAKLSPVIAVDYSF